MREWLNTLGVGQYARAFEEAAIAADVLGDLTDADLASMGIPLGHRKRILKAIAAMVPAAEAGEVPALVQQGMGPATTAERRQLTVLFCDLVGSTALSQRLDPEELRGLIRAYQDACAGAVSRFGGHVAQYLGDGVLAYFGYPVALEAGAESAIRAGIEIQECLGELARTFAAARSGQEPIGIRARVGIDTGLVVIGRSMEGSEQDRTAVGDAPNIAARLQSLAEPGSVVASARTRVLTSGRFDWTDLGLCALAGVAEPVQVWRVEGERVSATRFDAVADLVLAPMVGRDLEFATVMAAWQQARSGRSQALLLCGEPGIGKSRIVRALREAAQAEGVVPWQYQCSPFHVNSDLYPIVAHFERVLRFERDEPAEARLDRLHHMVCSRFGRPAPDANLLARLFSLPAEPRYGALPNLSPQRQKEETIRALGDLVVAASRDAPVLFLFEDAHWADPTSLDALAAVVARFPEMRVLMVLTHRPEFKAAWSGQPGVVSLTLGKLDARGVAEMTTRAAGGRPLPEALVRQIVDKTDGVPLFVEELTKAILESGVVRDTPGGWVLAAPLHDLSIPSTLRDSLMARLDRLAPTKETAQIGACIGREFPDELLAQVSPLPRSELDRALDQLVRAELVFRRGQGRDTVYVFKHALVQDAAYDSLLKSRRAQLHARIAAVLEKSFPEVVSPSPEVLAHHYQLARMMPEAAAAWTRADRLAFSRFALPEAVAHGEKALEAARAIGDPRVRDTLELEARTQHGMTWMALGGWFNPNVEKALLPAWGLARAQRRYDLYMPILWGLCLHALTEGRTGDSLAWVREFLEAAEATGDEDLRMVAHMSAVVCHFWHGDLREARRHGDIIESRYDPRRHGHIVRLTSHDPLTTTGIYATHWLWMLGHPDQALASCMRKDTHALRVGHWFDIGFAWTLGQWVHQYLGSSSALERQIGKAAQLGVEQGIPFFTHLQVPYTRVMLASQQPDLKIAIAEARAVLATLESLGGRIAAPFIRSQLALAIAKSGDLPQALAEIDGCLEQISRPGWEERSHFAEVLRVAAVLREQAGEGERAEALYRQSIAVARDQDARGWELRTATNLARLLRARGREREAREVLQPVCAWFTEGLGTRDVVEARQLLGELA